MFSIRAAISLLLVLAGCAGCQAVGAVAGKALGTQPIPATYVPRNVDTLVFAEHRPGASVDDASTQDMGRRVALIWQREKVAPIIEPAKLDQLRSDSSGKFTSMSIVDVGRKLKAAQVLYIDVLNDQIESPPASDLIRGKMTVHVRIIDTTTGDTLWPRDATDGYPMESQSDWMSRGEGVNDSTMSENLHNALAEDIVRLFYKFTPAN
jgi:hypothetical protein